MFFEMDDDRESKETIRSRKRSVAASLSISRSEQGSQHDKKKTVETEWILQSAAKKGTMRRHTNEFVVEMDASSMLPLNGMRMVKTCCTRTWSAVTLKDVKIAYSYCEGKI